MTCVTRCSSSRKSGIFLSNCHTPQVKGWLRRVWHPKTVQNGSYQTKVPKNPLTWPACDIFWQGKNSASSLLYPPYVVYLFFYAPFQWVPNWPCAMGMTGTQAIGWLSREPAVLLLMTHSLLTASIPDYETLLHCLTRILSLVWSLLRAVLVFPMFSTRSSNQLAIHWIKQKSPNQSPIDQSREREIHELAALNWGCLQNKKQ